MKQLNNYILEKLHLNKDISIINGQAKKEYKSKDGMFVRKMSIRASDDFSFASGENVLLIKYDTHHYEAQVRGVYEINKVNKNTISLKSKNSFYTDLKFDIKGICVNKNKNKYLGNSTSYWVLYNKDLIEDDDIKELLNNGCCSWGFKFLGNKEEEINKLNNYIKQI